MIRNMGSVDRGVRALFAVIVGLLWAGGMIGGTGAIVLGVIAAVMVGTALLGHCPLYLPFGISTRRRSV